MDLSFIKSNRFWAIVIGAVVVYLKAKGWIGTAETILIESIVVPFVGVRTIDRLGDRAAGL